MIINSKDIFFYGFNFLLDQHIISQVQSTKILCRQLTVDFFAIKTT